MIKDILIPNERVAVLIGKRGETKRKISKLANVSIKIDGNLVTITGEPINVLKAENVIYAIGRGFSPKNAFKLLNEDYFIDTVEIPGEKNVLERLRARVIGTHGDVKKQIEQSTHTTISVYGKTVCIIGRETEDATEAVKMIVNGRRLNTVFKFLKKRKEEKVML